MLDHVKLFLAFFVFREKVTGISEEARKKGKEEEVI